MTSPARPQRLVYLLHFIDPETGQSARYRHAAHYLGSTDDLPRRLGKHRNGQGARLVEVITQAGLGFVLARTWEGGRDLERQLKNRHNAAEMCPECGVTPRARWLRQAAAHLAAASMAKVPARELDDWPVLTGRLTPLEAGELTDRLSRGAQAAYAAAAQARSAAEWDARLATALEVDLAKTKAAQETAELHGRDPRQPMGEWITRTRQQAPQRQRQEEQMFGRRARAERRQQAEADRLFAEADRLAEQIEASPNYRREITAQRAARVMRQELATPYGTGYTQDRDLTWADYTRGELDGERDAAKAGDGTALPGNALDAEISRLALAFPGPGDLAPGAGADAATAAAREERVWAEGERQRARDRAAGAGDRGPSDRDNPHERWSQTPGGRDGLTGEPQADRGAEPDTGQDAADHLHGSPGCVEPGPEAGHLGWSQPEPEDTGRLPLPRILHDSEVNPALAPIAATLPDGTPHADAFLAARGWQAHAGVYVRRDPEAGLEAG